MWRLQKLEKSLKPRSKRPDHKERVWYTKRTFEKFPEEWDLQKLSKKEVLDNIISEYGEGRFRFRRFFPTHIELIDFKDIEQEGMLRDIEKRLNEGR